MKCYVVLVSLAVVLATSQEAAVSEEKSEESGDKLLDSGERHRRSGDVIGYISSKLAPKISAFASASAGLSSLSSEPKPEYGPPAEEAKSFDIWAFKKALLSTLLQAAKAIKGGLIAIKGQIIKAKGHFLSAKGRYISAKGEAISNFGKQVASTALNLDAAKEHSPHPSAPSHPTAHSAGYLSGLTGSSGYGSTGPGYVSGTGYGVPPPQISTGYGAPTAPSGLYGAPFKISARGSSGKTASQTTKSSSSLPPGAHAGLLVIKPIPSSASSSGGARASSHGTSNLHDFFGAPSQAVGTFVAAPAPFSPSAVDRRMDLSSYVEPQSDYSILPAFSMSYDL